jgi:S1-C subfamily serine protease
MGLLETFSDELEALVQRVAASVVAVQHRGGHGSGLLFTADGHVLTNAHVVRGASDVGIELADGSEARGRVVGRDPKTDLAVVRTETAGAKHFALASAPRARMGQLVVAIGNPLRLSRSVSLGVVSAVDRTLSAPGSYLEGLVQTDAAINPGNSGGPLLSVRGEVVGVNTAILPYAQGIGFAVPATTASWIAARLLQRGEVRRPYVGIAAHGVELPSVRASELGQPRALHVAEVGGATPAESAGLREGDLLLRANGTIVGSVDDLQRVLVLGEPSSVELEIARKRDRVHVTVRPRAAQVH